MLHKIDLMDPAQFNTTYNKQSTKWFMCTNEYFILCYYEFNNNIFFPFAYMYVCIYTIFCLFLIFIGWMEVAAVCAMVYL